MEPKKENQCCMTFRIIKIFDRLNTLNSVFLFSYNDSLPPSSVDNGLDLVGAHENVCNTVDIETSAVPPGLGPVR